MTRTGPEPSAPFPEGVLFDMDGLLLDTERLAQEAFVQACAELGWSADLDVYRQCIGSTEGRTRELLSAVYGDGSAYETLDACWSQHYRQRVESGAIPVKSGALALLEYLHGQQVPLGLVTSTRRQLAVDKLARVGFSEFFRATVCGGETAQGKPHPAPYLEAARKIAVAADACWALEDSANGVRAAVHAGCRVYQVPDLVEPSAELRALGHQIVSSLEDVQRVLERLR